MSRGGISEGDRLESIWLAILVELHRRAARAKGQSAEWEEVRDAIGLSSDEFKDAVLDLVGRRLVAGARKGGLYLTDRGWNEASRRVRVLPDEEERSAKGPIGFPEPGDKGSSEDEV